MANPFRAGGADCWYSGIVGDLWVEYKFIKKLPVKAPVRFDLSVLQLRWLNNRYAEGRNVCVIVGCPEGGVVLVAGEWNRPMSVGAFKQRLQSRQDLGGYIQNQTGVSPSCASYASLKELQKVFPESNEL